jgi:hypothetical protein
MSQGRRFKGFACPLPHETGNQVLGISQRTGCPVSRIFRKFFKEEWDGFLNRHPEWKALADLGPLPEAPETEEGETA